MLIAYTIYFSLLATVFDPSLPDGPRTVQMLMLFGGVTVVQAIVVAIVSAVLAIRARREAQAKPDERDRAIARRGAKIGRAHVRTPVTNAPLVCRLLPEKKNDQRQQH